MKIVHNLLFKEYMKTLVIGASLQENKYSNQAVKKLRKYNNEVIAIGNKNGFIQDVEVVSVKQLVDNIDTITLYLNSKNQKEYYSYIINCKPKRVIFNPGTENEELYRLLEENNLKYIEACTLVLLATNQY